MTDSTNTFGRRPRGRPATIQWQAEVRCSCAGKPADRRQDDLPQAKSRKSQGQIACGCRARIVLTQISAARPSSSLSTGSIQGTSPTQSKTLYANAIPRECEDGFATESARDWAGPRSKGFCEQSRKC